MAGLSRRFSIGNARRGNVVEVERVLIGIAAARDVAVDDIVSGLRTTYVVRARHEGMWMARVMHRATVTLIGDVFGGRDHSTVSNGVAKIAALVNAHPNYGQELKAICDQIAIITHEPAPNRIAVLPEAEVEALLAAYDSERHEAKTLRQSIANLETRRAMDQASILRLEQALKKARTQRQAVQTFGACPTLDTVLSAFDQLQQDRYGRGEQRAFDRLLTSLSHLKAEMTSAKGASS